MQLSARDDLVEIRLSRAEAIRLAVGLNEGGHSTSRAEYYIRTGLSQPNVGDVVTAILSVAESDAESSIDIVLAGGIEAVENPPRPRP